MQVATGVVMPLPTLAMFWSCPALATYWTLIFKTLSEELNIDFQSNATAAIFDITDRKNSALRKRHKNSITVTTPLAYRRILLHWHTTNPPKASFRFSDLMQLIQLEKIKYSFRLPRKNSSPSLKLYLIPLSSLSI